MACPFCSHTAYSGTIYPLNSFNGKEFRYSRCSQCSLVYLRPLPDFSDYEQMYPPSYQSSMADTGIMENQYEQMPGLRFSYGYHFDLIKKHANPNAHILDYGCGTGHFIANAVHNGFKCSGAEFNPDYVAVLANAMRESRFYLIEDLLNKEEADKFDVIRLSNVLEHLSDPVFVIVKLKSYLKPGGILLIEGPIEENFSLARNFRSFYFKLRKLISPGRVISAPPYHIFMSDRKNQREFFKKCGLTEIHFVVKEDTWPFPPSFAEAKGFSQKINALVAKISIGLSKVINRNAGNTFIYVGK